MGTGGCYWVMIHCWEGELSSQLLGCLQAAVLCLIYKDFSKSVTLVVWYYKAELGHMQFCKKHGKEKVLHPRGNDVGGTWSPGAVGPRGCSADTSCHQMSDLQQAPDSAAVSVFMALQFVCENRGKSSALPYFSPAVRVFCHWFLWDHSLVELRGSAGRDLRHQVHVREAYLPFRGSWRKSCPISALLSLSVKWNQVTCQRINFLVWSRGGFCLQPVASQ